MCRVTQYLLYATCYVTIYTLVAVAIIRYGLVVKNSRSPWITSEKYAIITSLLIWIVVLIIKTPVLMIHGVSRNSFTDRVECIVSGRQEGQRLFATFFIFAYVIPLFIIASLYILVIKILRKRRHQRLTQSRVAETIMEHPESEKRSRHVTRTTIVVVVVFAVCW